MDAEIRAVFGSGKKKFLVPSVSPMQEKMLRRERKAEERSRQRGRDDRHDAAPERSAGATRAVS